MLNINSVISELPYVAQKLKTHEVNEVIAR